jgi:glycosyltransferase involved in cell wall biosynthesis
VQDVYQRAFRGVVAHVPPTVPLPAASDTHNDRAALRGMAGLAGDSFVFLGMFDGLSYLARKNPLAAVEAFQRAFPERRDVALVLKGHHRPPGAEGGEAHIWRGIDQAARRDSRIRLIEATLPYGDVMRLIGGADAFVSLHRSEGFGLGPAEAMMRGVPAIVTAYGGTEDFCDDTTALRVPFSLVPVLPGGYLHAEEGHLWADPDIAVAAAHMRLLAEDLSLRTRIGAAGQARTARQFSLEAVAPDYARAFDRLVGRGA